MNGKCGRLVSHLTSHNAAFQEIGIKSPSGLGKVVREKLVTSGSLGNFCAKDVDGSMVTRLGYAREA